MDVKQAVELIRFASDVILCTHPSEWNVGPFAYTRRLTCDALRTANRELFADHYHSPEITRCLEAFGLLGPSANLHAFAEFDDDEIQGARFLWLDFLAHVLENQPDLFDYCQTHYTEAYGAPNV